MSARKIAAWHEAGLIDAATRDRLLAHEAEHARPLALWAVFGIGALAIGLGLVSVIAANWEDIPGQLRLAVHLALIVAALAALFLREARMAAASPWAVEALLFVSAALGLTFFGHLRAGLPDILAVVAAAGGVAGAVRAGAAADGARLACGRQRSWAE